MTLPGSVRGDPSSTGGGRVGPAGPGDPPGPGGAGGPGGRDGPPTDPFAAPTARPWYRRRAVVVVAAVVVIIGVTVVADLPQHSSRAQQVAIATTVVKAVDTDVGPCAYAVRQTFSLYQRETDGAVTASERAQIPGLMRDDQAACSFTDQSVVNLSTITIPGSAAGRDLGSVIKMVLVWSTSDALSAIDDLETLSAEPHDAGARADLDKQERLLAADRAQADGELQTANHALGGAHVPDPTLPRLPAPGSTG